VVLSGPGELTSVAGAAPGGVGLFIGEPGIPASLTLAGSGIYHVSLAESIRVESGSTLELNQGGHVYTTHSDAYIRPGAFLRISGGTFNPGETHIQGNAIVTDGLLTGEYMDCTSTASLLVTGPTARAQSQEGWFAVGGNITVTNGGQVNFRTSTTGTGVAISVTNGGSVAVLSAQFDAGSVVTVGDGGVWRGTGTFNGPFVVQAGADFLFGGTFNSTVALDQAAVVSRSWLTLTNGLAVEIDGLADPVASLVPAFGQSNSTTLAGPLTVQVRNPNALRVGDVIPIFRHEAGDTQAFSGLVAPDIGGGRVLTLTRTGNPATSSIVVDQGPASCYTADFNGDGDVGTDQDIEAFFACLGGDCCATCASTDFNGDGDLGTDLDIEAFFRVLGGGAC
jgi:hypothetical protein